MCNNYAEMGKPIFTKFGTLIVPVSVKDIGYDRTLLEVTLTFSVHFSKTLTIQSIFLKFCIIMENLKGKTWNLIKILFAKGVNINRSKHIKILNEGLNLADFWASVWYICTWINNLKYVSQHNFIFNLVNTILKLYK